jgi:hypothetical protein
MPRHLKKIGTLDGNLIFAPPNLIIVFFAVGGRFRGETEVER